MSGTATDADDIEAMIGRLRTGPCDSFADVGGGALDLARIAVTRWDADIWLIDLNADGTFAEQWSPWLKPYITALRTAGADSGRVRIVNRIEDLRPVDVIANLDGFGDRAKIKHLEPVLARALHAESRMLCDIRKGSGSFPFLNAYGACEILWSREAAGKLRSRVLFTPNPPVAAATGLSGAAGEWAGIARDLAGPGGFYRANPEHSFLFIPRDKTLVVTFDNLDIAMGKRDDRRPWGFAFIEKQGWSMLGVMANGWTWYRDPWVAAEFDRLAAEGFFARFDRVVFYGASMGGYAACAFSAAAPGADVVAISPQSTLDKALVPWETRYSTAWGRDFSGPYGDAAAASAWARQVSILFDPYEPLDRGHAERFTGANVTFLRAPLLGHRLGSSLNQMGILGPTILAALEGRLAPSDFYQRLRARHTFPRYQRELFQRALDRGRPGLAERVGRWALRHDDSRFFRQALRSLPTATG